MPIPSALPSVPRCEPLDFQGHICCVLVTFAIGSFRSFCADSIVCAPDEWLTKPWRPTMSLRPGQLPLNTRARQLRRCSLSSLERLGWFCCSVALWLCKQYKWCIVVLRFFNVFTQPAQPAASQSLEHCPNQPRQQSQE